MPSVMQRLGTPNSRHNVDIKYRAQLENVDPTLSKYNTAVHRKTVEQIYAEKLQPAFDAFNARQKRKDRRLDVKWGATTALDYQRALDKAARESKNSIDQKGRPPIREIVWQIGNPEQGYGSRSQTRESRENIKQMLLECQTKAEKRFPQFAWGDQDFHADEVSQDADEQEHGSLHLHSAFVPLCFKNKQGPAVQVAFERCLKEMGFATFQDFKHELDSLMEEVLKEHGLERTVMDNHREHQSSKEFHRQQKIIKQTQELEAKAAAAEKVADEADREAEAAKLGATEAQNRKDELLAEIEKLEKKKSDAEGDAAEARERMQAESEAAAEAARKAEQAQQEALEAQRQLAVSQEQLRGVERQIAAAKDENEALREENKKLKNDSDEKLKDYKYLAGKIQEQNRIYEYNQNYMMEQTEILELYKNHEQYLIGAEEAQNVMDDIQAELDSIPKHNPLQAKMRKWLELVLKSVKQIVSKLKIYEKTYPEEAPEMLSVPVEQRAASLDAQIFGASHRAGQPQDAPKQPKRESLSR